MRKSLEKLSGITDKRLEQNVSIDDELLARLKITIAEEIANNNLEAYGQHSEALHKRAKSAYTYGKVENSTPEDAFVLGAIYGMFGVLEEVINEPKRQALRKEQIECVRNNFDAFKYIRQSAPNGVTVEDLAEHLKIPKGECLQLVNHMQKDLHLLESSVLDRKLYYHIGSRAEMLIDLIEAESKKVKE